MNKPSTRNLAALPTPQQLERLSMSLAMLDAILLPDEWANRYYSFNKDWDADNELRMGSMRNGCGDDYYILFGASGVAIKGYAHECAMASPGSPPVGVLSEFPTRIDHFLTEPAFTIEDTSFCIWHLPARTWTVGDIRYPEGADPDGSGFLLGLLTRDPRGYQAFAEDYYEQDVPIETVEAIYAHEPLTTALVCSLNRETSKAALAEDIAQIGYPQS